jgi:prepilin-type N-terminal cleavage/methylation domain-containing protein
VAELSVRAAGRNARGFTLVEVLLAVALLAIGLTALTTTFSSGFGKVVESRAQMKAVEYGRQMLEQLRNQPFDSPTTGNDTPEADITRSWSIMQVAGTTAPNGLVIITVTVTWRSTSPVPDAGDPAGRVDVILETSQEGRGPGAHGVGETPGPAGCTRTAPQGHVTTIFRPASSRSSRIVSVPQVTCHWWKATRDSRSCAGRSDAGGVVGPSAAPPRIASRGRRAAPAAASLSSMR